MNWYSQELALIGKTEDDYAEQSIEKQAALRRQLIKYVIFLIAANSALSILMALFLVRNITSRLVLMKDNAVKLAHNEPLSPPLKGSDEIATLDAVFHEMAQSIDEAAQTKQNLFNMVTHDIRTPLSSIQGCLELLERADRDHALDERSQKLVKVAVRNSTRTMGLINDLLDSQKIQSGMMTLHAEELQLADSFEEVQLSMADLVSEYGIHLQIKAVDIQVLANRNMLNRILFNLISNALKYSPKGGSIFLEAKATGRVAEIAVTDQGPGIPEQLQASIFHPFKQVEKSAAEKGGSGLGLAICHDFVTLHGGKIWVVSKIGQGCTFYFTLPLASPGRSIAGSRQRLRSRQRRQVLASDSGFSQRLQVKQRLGQGAAGSRPPSTGVGSAETVSSELSYQTDIGLHTKRPKPKDWHAIVPH
jgi:signal transduction histidine kinase